MFGITLAHEVDFQGWRDAARDLALRGTPPEQVVWSVGAATDLFAAEAAPPAASGAFSVPRALVALAETVIQARDPARFGLLYALTWRVHQGERHVLEDAADPLLGRLQLLAAAVRRDTHKMRAFLRFREVNEPEGTRYVAWFEPSHFIVEANAGFFVRRFATLRWSILTPYRSLHWDEDSVRLGAGASRAEVPDDDALESYWRAYFSSVFNPARLKVSAMLSEMPKKYWQNMPETAAIPALVRQAQERTSRMVEAAPAPAHRPEQKRRQEERVADREERVADDLAQLGQEAAGCQRCGLWQHATQTVFGEGRIGAPIMLVGEQPGDQEDLAGRPFVGPAGQMLDRALRDAGIDRAATYVTNAVKHFKFEPRGKRRIHATPDRLEIETCRFWLEQEMRLVRPAVIVALGASAARALLQRSVTISRERGTPIPLPEAVGIITVHPSYLLRLPDLADKEAAYKAFVSDLYVAGGLLKETL